MEIRSLGQIFPYYAYFGYFGYYAFSRHPYKAKFAVKSRTAFITVLFYNFCPEGNNM